MAPILDDPFARESWIARMRWRMAERRVRREFEADTLIDLKDLVAGSAEVAWLDVPPSCLPDRHRLVGPVELLAGGKRIAASAVWGPAWSTLSSESAAGVVRLVGVGRYAGGWLLRFASNLRHGEIPVLASGLRVVPPGGGLAALGRGAPSPVPSLA